jgi:acetyltransferase
VTIRNLEGFFTPQSVAVIGPSRLEDPTVDRLLETLSDTVGKRPIHLIDVKRGGVWEEHQARSLDDFEPAPDLAICLGPAQEIPDKIRALAGRGTRAVLLLSQGFESWPEALLQSCREAARETSLRLIGPGSQGLAVPALAFNALLSAETPLKGDIAFFARSGAVLNATLSWAASRRTGFSAVVSLGARTDVDIGDLIDYFAQDYRTRAILLHLESLSSPQKFISAARAASRSKPVIVIRSGRSRDITGTGRTHAGRLADPDLVYEAVFRRTGILRVDSLDEMFEAVETLSRIRVPKCESVAVIANGRSLTAIAADRLTDLGGQLASLEPETIEALAPHCRQVGYPGQAPEDRAQIVLKDDLPVDDLKTVLKTVLADKGVDGVVTAFAATAFTPLRSIGNAIAETKEEEKRRTRRPKALVTALVGGDGTTRAALDGAGIPCFASPSGAVRSMMHLVRDAEARDFLMAVPPSLPAEFTPDTKAARSIIDTVRREERDWLSPTEVAGILAAYEIPLIGTCLAETPDAAAKLSEPFFETARHCVVKLVSPDLPFKSRIDGVRLGLEDPQAVGGAAEELIGQTRRMFPQARIAGVSVHPMLEDRHGLELFLGLADTPVFGPVIVFGHGGTVVEESGDLSLELPPLDLKLADALIDRTRISRLLGGTSSRPTLDREAVGRALVKLSQISIDLPEILELDINPLTVTQNGVIALDARITLGEPARHAGRRGRSRLAIAPYPKEWEQTLTLKGGQPVFVRPVRPEDEDDFRAFFEQISTEDLRLRFFAPVRDFSHRFLAQLTQLDYARAMAFAAYDPETGDMLGVVRLHTDPDHLTGEYAILVRSDLKGVGLGWALMKLIIRYAQVDGVKTVKGEVLKENTSMLSMCEGLGFAVKTSPDDPGVADVTLDVADLIEKLED